MPTTIAERLIDFYLNLQPPSNLPKGVETLHPQKNEDVRSIIRTFFSKYYDDNNPRRMLIGINPGRFGAGITGINFTGPRQLRDDCGIDNPFGNSSELSAEFIYEVIQKYGGSDKFYSKFYVSAVSPLGYIKDGINLNYYDDKELQQSVVPYATACLKEQLSFGFDTDRCICIGGAKNFTFLSRLNSENGFFREIVPVPHPRFILQYKRKQKDQFVDQYLSALL
ncbi:MAG: DUF4918 family protein [Chitinophagaceae bacterium]|nr:DUF4918 family protein [Chitinophagaceae bacterium]